MESHDSRSVSKILEAYVGDLIAESNFFSDLSSGRVSPEDVRGVFGQYYLWRNQFHRWFGICVARIAPFGESLNVPRILGELIECLGQEIREDHHGLALSFLAALGIDDPSRITALPVTDTYAESFLRCYFSGDRSGDEALAALAGRELAVPGRNRIILRALPEHYGVTSGLEFFGLHNSIEVAHFRGLWEAMAHDHKADTRRLIEAARLEIWEHITFWDDVYCAILEARSELSAPSPKRTGPCAIAMPRQGE
jgi:hypothetical protein